MFKRKNNKNKLPSIFCKSFPLHILKKYWVRKKSNYWFSHFRRPFKYSCIPQRSPLERQRGSEGILKCNCSGKASYRRCCYRLMHLLAATCKYTNFCCIFTRQDHEANTLNPTRQGLSVLIHLQLMQYSKIYWNEHKSKSNDFTDQQTNCWYENK